MGTSPKQFFKIDESPFPTASINTREAKWQAQLKPLSLDTTIATRSEDEEELAKLMWEQREELSDSDSDIWDYCNWKWLQGTRDLEKWVSITIDEFLTMRGMLKKLNGKGQRGGFKKTQKEEVLRNIIHLQNILVNLFEIEVYSRRVLPLKNGKETIQDRAVRIREQGQIDLAGNLHIQGFSFRPGVLFSRFLFGPGRQVAMLSAQALRYHPKYEKYEKRLTRNLDWQWRIKAAKLDYFKPYRVRTLLEAIRLEVDRRIPSRTFNRLERALDRLQSDEVIRTWQWATDSASMDKAGWVDEWLDNNVFIEPPQAIFERYKDIPSHKPGQGGLIKITELSERLKKKRALANLSVSDVAEKIGLPTPDYFHAESGSWPSASARSKLEKWLQEFIAS